jgi:riboflavin synthase
LNVRGTPPTDDNILKVAAHPRVREHAENLVTDLEKFRVR